MAHVVVLLGSNWTCHNPRADVGALFNAPLLVFDMLEHGSIVRSIEIACKDRMLI